MCILKLAKKAECRGDLRGARQVGGEGGSRSRCPFTHPAILSISCGPEFDGGGRNCAKSAVPMWSIRPPP